MTEEALFELARNTPEAERAALLDREAAGDPALRARVEARLHADERTHVLDPPAELTRTFVGGEAGVSLPPPDPLASTLLAGRYKLLQRLGEGGMGTVYLALQLEPVKRSVAVKVIKPGMDSNAVLARFDAERQAIARMDHPHIAKLLDAGSTELGRPYFVMELVKGVPVTEYCDAERLTVADRLRLFRQICGAVQHAHQKGVIHRDLKPSNILVEARAGRPVPKVIDFGLAKAIAGLPLTEQPLLTRLGTAVGTPRYMAPEQAAADPADIDTRADVYALGVLLFELLTGTTPITGESVQHVLDGDVLKVVREWDAPTPSSRLASRAASSPVAVARRSDPARLCRQVRGELDWIALKALNRERDRRYDSAAALSEDVGRYLTHQPVQAGPPSTGYRLRKFVRRNRPHVVAAGVLLLALVGGVIGTSWGLIRAESARAAETTARRRAETSEARATAWATAEARARRREQAQRVKAEAAEIRIVEALDATTRFAGGRRLAAPALTPDQRAFLTHVLHFYRPFTEEPAEDDTGRARKARAAHRVGFIEYRLGHHDEAAAALRLARDTYSTLSAAHPAVVEYRWELAGTHSNLGNLLVWRGKPEEAVDPYRRAIAIIQGLTAEPDSDPEQRRLLASNWACLGNVLVSLRRWDEAEEPYRHALALLERLCTDQPARSFYRHEWAANHHRLGVLQYYRGNLADSETAYLKAQALQEALAAAHPTEAIYRAELAATHTNFGHLLACQDRTAEADEHFRQAEAIRNGSPPRELAPPPKVLE